MIDHTRLICLSFIIQDVRLFYAEEKEVEDRDPQKDLSLFKSTTSDIRKCFKDIKDAKNKGGKQSVCTHTLLLYSFILLQTKFVGIYMQESPNPSLCQSTFLFSTTSPKWMKFYRKVGCYMQICIKKHTYCGRSPKGDN